jgi:hypothetical protein
LTSGTNIACAQLRLVVHTIWSNCTWCNAVVKLFSTAFEVLTDVKRWSTNTTGTSIKTLSILRRIWTYLIMWICYNSCCLDSMSWLVGWRKSLSSSLLMLKMPCTIWWLSNTCVDRMHLLAVRWRHGLHWIGVSRVVDCVAVHYCSVSAFPKSLLQTTPLATRTMTSTTCRYRNSLRVNRLLDKAPFLFRLLIISPVRMPSGVCHVVRWVLPVKLLDSYLRRREPLTVASYHFLCRVANSH